MSPTAPTTASPRATAVRIALRWMLSFTGFPLGGLAAFVTTSIGVQVTDQFTVFGAAGAITVAALTSVLPLSLSRSAH